MAISIIVALDSHRAIGKNGGLLCHLPADLKHFKETTTGHTVIMGRRTFDSLPKGALPNRRNIVVTRNPGFSAERVEVAHSFDEALSMVDGEAEAFVIGGAQIYGEAIAVASRLYLTEIEAEFSDADTFFPEIDMAQWKVVAESRHEADEKNQYAMRFVTLQKGVNS